MALSDNIKKFREEKNLTQQQLADKLYVSRQTVCRWENGSRCPDLITAKKLALELDVSMDELISDEDVNDIQLNYGIWKSERMQNRTHLQEFRKKLLNFMEILGSIFMAIILLFRIQLERDIPLWLTISFFCIAISFITVNLLISKKLREM
ncbi:helix-turn-helix transcriptional regulator [Hespellia stercorisuis]|uniref:DNA-binding transcriptional regulator, XRE-family HTH domain n=1 Tax=Hespellia stercorisuis DSM 15480 TaxID=1121950 RepID=A0A1M6Q7R3_9FIRM|nr:helix-turn-helix domain-containing protein [Hespellia stercorisuis]SHK16190.1 DNA-binding transcriptional regulator, XRE-family HTH domain [Hespellia stercorisuis DSM 15480]